MYNHNIKMTLTNSTDEEFSTQNTVEGFAPECRECDNFSSGGKRGFPTCMEGQDPKVCVESPSTRFFPRGGSKESL